MSASVAGTGQTIGLVEFDGFQMSDVSDYLSLTGYPSSELSNLSVVSVNGGIATPGASQDEVLLDIDTTMSVAPGAKTVVYEAPFAGAGASFQPILNKMVSDGVTIISNSWAYCEDQTTAADVESIDMINQQAAMSGISVFNGSGDDGKRMPGRLAECYLGPGRYPECDSGWRIERDSRPRGNLRQRDMVGRFSDLAACGPGRIRRQRILQRAKLSDWPGGRSLDS